MGRWRPPLPESAPYITPQGYAALHAELEALWLRRREVTVALSAAAAEGDRSENAEYIYRKKELREIDRRIRYLQKRLPDLTVVQTVASRDQVYFGAWVELEREDGSRVEYRIVGADELDAAKAQVSVDSPMGRALLKKRIDDEVEVALGDRIETYCIIDIRYVDDAWCQT